MEPVSTMGKFGRGMMITAGVILLLIGIGLIIMQLTSPPDPECLATITGFSVTDENRRAENSVTLVSYEANGKKYTDVELGQYEKSWKVGDTIYIQYSRDDPQKIRTMTMKYLGWILLIASMPFLSIGLFFTVSLRRKAVITPEEEEEDEEKTTKGKLKYKVSSIVIPLCAGIPVLAIGMIFMHLEHNYVFGLLALVLGAVAVFAGLISVCYYIILIIRSSRQNKE